MRDTDWRPSPCPACGETRAAEEHPKCTNYGCLMLDVPTNSDRYSSLIPVLESLGDDKASVGGKINSRKSVSFKDSRGKPHNTLKDAIASYIAELLDDMSEPWDSSSALLAHYMIKDPMRSTIIRLLQEAEEG